MRDLTRVFQAAAGGIGGVSAGVVSSKKPEAEGDTFVKECEVLFRLIRELLRVLREVAPEYRGPSGGPDVDVDVQDRFDTEFTLQFQQYCQKYKQLERYELGRQELVARQAQGKRAKNTASVLHNDMRNRFRLGVLSCLNLSIGTVSKRFTSMQQDRLRQQRTFQQLEFAPSEGAVLEQDAEDHGSAVSISQSSQTETVQDEVRLYEETMSKLTQEQLQILATEHEELLHAKDEQLENVERINKTILDIVSLQNELSTHLQTQSQNITAMLDNQDEVELNIDRGNKQLRKAQRSASYSAKMITWMAILMAIMILFVDFIN
ncbi:Ufe1p KNAG_0C06460 [Huiozyma naganishii CBS 8797]|uniref:t-SNARE coiled-coil homology domain-containing protein n=1 Tax=Huiozyma naganishii (strain ATCC MYA-139 / BCRC 22969 / CBS 8797 / KCTC 17520 / NBRC 10181 / NCYC 3082 / Yp74L-3) TaxID=1071383 RepID=J7S595_HUIN7|nr:hypothetical protein KNAG_0C06460 [Kazachstania naganishii CBS 8797]CCK69739.1 hypothetical protein KNAG_0C06460 [Kazachstania naganishii CBS 8797]